MASLTPSPSPSPSPSPLPHPHHIDAAVNSITPSHCLHCQNSRHQLETPPTTDDKMMRRLLLMLPFCPPSPSTASTNSSSEDYTDRAHLHTFGLHIRMLGPIHTSPSPLHPLVNPLPLTLGFEIPLYGDQHAMTPTFHVIHASRFNKFDPAQPQVFLTLSDSSSSYLPCPGYSAGTNSLFFLARPLGQNSPLQIEVLAKMEVEGLIKRTGRTVGEVMAQEYHVDIPIEGLAKKCGGCGRWEALVKRPGTDGVPVRMAYRYRRWQTCGGCGVAWFCSHECLRMAWENGHWRGCLKLRGLRDSMLALRDYVLGW